ncbi:MAG: ABC transporter ATP-binding protein [Actinomycetota bacterium]
MSRFSIGTRRRVAMVYDTDTDAGGLDHKAGIPGADPAPPAPTLPADGRAVAPPGQEVATVMGVSKRFGDVQALDGLDIGINRSRITVLLGPNGAGKTTAIRLITGAFSPDEGRVRVFGLDPSGDGGEEVRRRCGVVSAKPSLYDRLSGIDNLRYAAELYGLGRGKAVDERIDEAAAWFGIEPALGQLVGGYSTGMKTRLALARAILHDPELLLLDEPTSGLDPESARSVLRLVREMTARGRSVLLCTHLLAEAEGLADEIVVVDGGRTVLRGEPRRLAGRYWPLPQVTFRSFDDRGLAYLNQHPRVIETVPVDGGVRVSLSDEPAVASVARWLTEHGTDLRAIVPWEPTLEDLYFAIRAEHDLDRPNDILAMPPTGGKGNRR